LIASTVPGSDMVNIPDCLGTKFEQRLLLKSAEDLLRRFDLVCFYERLLFTKPISETCFQSKIIQTAYVYASDCDGCIAHIDSFKVYISILGCQI